jgi:hypothetical protein
LNWKKLEYQGTFGGVDEGYTGKIGSVDILVFVKG